MRPCDIDRSGETWTYRPESHKTEHHDRDRVVFIGPKAQAVLLRYLARDPSMYCFRPCDSEAKRRAEAARLAALQKARAARAKPADSRPSPPPQRAAAPPPTEPARPTPPSIKYKFIGYLGPPENKIAVLHDGTDMVFVSSGDELEEKFLVLDIGYESIKFGFLDPQFENESKTLPMTSTP